jgi:hypothetical protein
VFLLKTKTAPQGMVELVSYKNFDVLPFLAFLLGKKSPAGHGETLFLS